MAIVKFPTKITYNGERYPANVDIEVDDKDVKSLIEDGCFVVEEPKPTRAMAPQTKSVETKSVLDNPSPRSKKG